LDLQIKGKIAIVTGGSRGIGKAIARELAREGADVAIVARDAAALEVAAAEISRETGRRVERFVADTGDDGAVKAMVAGVIAAFGRIDILVNGAASPGGQGKPPLLAEITDAFFFADVNVKVMGYVRTAREVAPHMARQGGGRIINISTVGSIRNIGVAALTKNLADELAPQGISVVCVHPGRTRTEKTAGVIEREAKAKAASADEIEQQMAGHNLVHRLITAEEIAHVVAFLASPKSVAINGDSIAAGGGMPGAIFY
jgi:NAD(P)-dependent dehydrogenase (short-subunit alcohol dehydrogenase family)